MTNQFDDQDLYTMVNLNLCVHIEIVQTNNFLHTELEYSKQCGYETQIQMLEFCLNKHTKVIAEPFEKEMVNYVMFRRDDRTPDLMDYLFAQSRMPKSFIRDMNNCKKFLRKHFPDSYRLSAINTIIDNTYPGMEYNSDLYPHENLNEFLRKLSNKF